MAAAVPGSGGGDCGSLWSRPGNSSTPVGVPCAGYLDWMERQFGEGAQTVEVPVPETDDDCVRIMTIHAAKGLEFPVVILTGLGNQRRHRSDPVIIDRVSGRVEARVSASGQTRLETSGFDAANKLEAAAQAAEDVRLAYVACTRARDHLVLSLFRKSQRNDTSPAGLMEQFCAARPDLWREIGVDSLSTPAVSPPPASAPQPPPNAAEFNRQRGQWLEDRAATIAAASRKEARAVTAIARLEKDEAEGGEVVYRRGRGSSNLGRAVHAVLQSIDIITGEGLEAASRAQAAAEGIPTQWEEVAELARTAVDSDVVRRLASQLAAGQANYYREVFVSAPLNGRLVEGFIDLLIDGPGGMVVVDYKTDSLDTAQEVADATTRHRTQMGLYALATQEVTGKPVTEAVLLFLRPKEERSFTDIDALVADAKEAAAVGGVRGVLILFRGLPSESAEIALCDAKKSVREGELSNLGRWLFGNGSYLVTHTTLAAPFLGGAALAEDGRGIHHRRIFHLDEGLAPVEILDQEIRPIVALATLRVNPAY